MSDKFEVTTKVLQLLARYAPSLAGESTDPDTEITSLELDSLTLFEVVFEIEKCFAAELDETELAGISTVRDLVSSVQAAAKRFHSVR